jgi:hypothetical protein
VQMSIIPIHKSLALVKERAILSEVRGRSSAAEQEPFKLLAGGSNPPALTRQEPVRTTSYRTVRSDAQFSWA